MAVPFLVVFLADHPRPTRRQGSGGGPPPQDLRTAGQPRSVPGVAFITEPVIVTRAVRVLTGRLVLPVRDRTHGIDLGVGHRLAVDPHLMALPSLGLGHHLGDQIATQPHLPRLAPTGASTTL